MSTPAVVVVGKCRVCGCTDSHPCIDSQSGLPCIWVDRAHTLCDNLECIAVVPIVDLEKIWREQENGLTRWIVSRSDELLETTWTKARKL